MFLAEATARSVEIFGTSGKVWIVIVVAALFLGAILTSSFNDDKTKGL